MMAGSPQPLLLAAFPNPALAQRPRLWDEYDHPGAKARSNHPPRYCSTRTFAGSCQIRLRRKQIGSRGAVFQLWPVLRHRRVPRIYLHVLTEGNLERVLNLLKAMSPIAVIVDEADAQLGNRSSSGDSGVGNRVFAQIAQFMGNTELRGKVIWFLLTCRPDLLPVDLKRQGRAEEHIALFYPDTDEERLAMLRAMQKKTGTQVSSPDVEQFFLNHAAGLSGADVEAVLMRARMKSVLVLQR